MNSPADPNTVEALQATAAKRRQTLGLLARAPAAELDQRLQLIGALPEFRWLRAPETGMAMLRGRIGGNGEAFNLGEVTLTRCTLRLDSGQIGIAAVRGVNRQQAAQVAMCDALLQHPDYRERVREQVVEALTVSEQSRHAARAAEIAASKVDFFTLVRGED